MSEGPSWCDTFPGKRRAAAVAPVTGAYWHLSREAREGWREVRFPSVAMRAGFDLRAQGGQSFLNCLLCGPGDD